MYLWRDVIQKQASYTGALTAIGTPKSMPLKILKTPVNMRLELKSIEFAVARAVMIGRRVPRSPRLPDISPHGFLLSTWRLYDMDLAMPWRDWKIGRVIVGQAGQRSL